MESDHLPPQAGGISGEMMLQRHRALLLESRIYPLIYRAQLIVVVVATWFLPTEPIATFAMVALVATVLWWTWTVHRGRLRYQLFAVEEAIASAAISRKQEKWEDAYIRFRHDSLLAARLFTLEPLLWWLCAVGSIVARFPWWLPIR